ncbi:hypothetical protein [Niallia endozanthoxylica]|uniref:Uncharacterized protein n=1 Tax=Niallia endozanthoxylica TaxID=2036016 RepID=A0A5J5HZ87_9BACI|nr:hypothetical protein [Niallia endozanthoxylica]KAA9028482.1 hypothetical protein F4V44_04195 [Niallia endozanthoxylica]
MDLEWFDRVCGELQDSLDSICSKYDENGGMSVERGAKHPRMDFFIENGEEDRDYFCTIYFDPRNEEFYIESFDPDLGYESKVVLADIEDIVDAVHESFHIYLEEDVSVEEDMLDDDTEYYLTDNDEIERSNEDGDNSDIYLEEVDVEWETPEVTAYYQENEVEVTYQFGIVQETGDGVLRRVNRIWTEDDDLLKDETNFIFSKEEASTIIAMIASHMDSLSMME